MTENELARALFGRKKQAAEEAGSATVVVSATAVDSSSGGTVVVDFGTDVFGDTQTVDEQTGEVVYAPPSQGVEVPAAGGINAGDTVSVLVVDNQPVQAIGTGSVDRVGVVAEGARTTANEAKAVAEATGQHFWHNDNGAHVTEETRESYEQQPNGFQQLMTSIGTLLTRAVNGIEYLLRSDTQSGMAIYDGTCTADDANLAQHMVARFSADGAQIGRNTDVHVGISSRSFKIVSENGSAFVNIEDMRDENGVATVTQEFVSDGENPILQCGIPISSVISVTANGASLSYTTSTTQVVLDAAQPLGTTITVVYTTTSAWATRYNFSGGAGAPRSFAAGGGSPTGAYSHTTGLSTIASGIYSKASGYQSQARGFASSAGGANTVASQQCAVADGYGTTADGEAAEAHGYNTTASKPWSHSEGYNTQANGAASHAEGRGTIAASLNQHVQGRYNVADSSRTYADIIGCGTSGSNRENLATLDWNGTQWYKNNGNVICSDGTNVKCAGQTLGTTDNLSYVSSTDSIRSPVYGYATRNTSTTNGGSVQYARCGQLVIVFFSLSVTATANDAILATGLPKPPVNSFVPAVAAVNRGTGMYVDPDGRLRLTGSTSGSAWWIAAAPYFVRA